jgi:hypothetical protein
MASGSEGTVERLGSWNAVAVYVVIRYFTDTLTTLFNKFAAFRNRLSGDAKPSRTSELATCFRLYPWESMLQNCLSRQ